MFKHLQMLNNKIKARMEHTPPVQNHIIQDGKPPLNIDRTDETVKVGTNHSTLLCKYFNTISAVCQYLFLKIYREERIFVTPVKISVKNTCIRIINIAGKSATTLIIDRISTIAKLISIPISISVFEILNT